MKNSWEWEEEDLLSLVGSGAQESIELDFKASDSLQNTDKKKEDISKDVSSFANSAGGTLLYGVKEDKTTHVALEIDSGSDPKDITKEWLEQVINSKIHQRIDGIRINPIELKTLSPGKFAYAVFVPSSSRAPHQASDKRFYKRFNFHSVPMEEYEIRDVSRRGDIPDLRIKFGLPAPGLIQIAGTNEFEPVKLQAVITNDAIEPAFYAVIKLFIDARLEIIAADGSGVEMERDRSISLANKEFPITLISINWGGPGKMPIFYAVFDLVENLLFKVPNGEKFDSSRCFIIGYEIKSPRMPVKSSFVLLGIQFENIYLLAENVNVEEILKNVLRK